MHSIVMGSHRALVSKTLSAIRPIAYVWPFLCVLVHVHLHFALPATNVRTTSGLARKSTFFVAVGGACGVVAVGGACGVIAVCRVS